MQLSRLAGRKRKKTTVEKKSTPAMERRPARVTARSKRERGWHKIKKETKNQFRPGRQKMEAGLRRVSHHRKECVNHN